jgi:putative FmdB family regulatory protein
MTYEYACDVCDVELEIQKPMAESSREEKCEDCGNVLRRVFSTPQVVNYGNYFDTMTDSERWGYAEHKRKTEADIKKKAAQGIKVDKVENVKGTPSEFRVEHPK